MTGWCWCTAKLIMQYIIKNFYMCKEHITQHFTTQICLGIQRSHISYVWTRGSFKDKLWSQHNKGPSHPKTPLLKDPNLVCAQDIGCVQRSYEGSVQRQHRRHDNVSASVHSNLSMVIRVHNGQQLCTWHRTTPGNRNDNNDFKLCFAIIRVWIMSHTNEIWRFV